jgi:hypothetical protein
MQELKKHAATQIRRINKISVDKNAGVVSMGTITRD